MFCFFAQNYKGRFGQQPKLHFYYFGEYFKLIYSDWLIAYFSLEELVNFFFFYIPWELEWCSRMLCALKNCISLFNIAFFFNLPITSFIQLSNIYIIHLKYWTSLTHYVSFSIITILLHLIIVFLRHFFFT